MKEDCGSSVVPERSGLLCEKDFPNAPTIINSVVANPVSNLICH